MLKKVFASTRGQGLVEYALILVLVAIVVIVILALLGPAVGNVYSNVVTHLVQDPQGGGAEDEGDGENGDNGGEEDCYGSLLLSYLVGTTALSWLMLWSVPAIRSAVKVR